MTDQQILERAQLQAHLEPSKPSSGTFESAAGTTLLITGGLLILAWSATLLQGVITIVGWIVSPA